MHEEHDKSNLVTNTDIKSVCKIINISYIAVTGYLNVMIGSPCSHSMQTTGPNGKNKVDNKFPCLDTTKTA